MNKNEENKKGSIAVANILSRASDIGKKTVDIGKKAADGVQKGAKALSDKTKNDSYLRRMKKYNPLFPHNYTSSEFKLPNMIVIVDDAVRRGIDVCEGAIGWLDKENGMEVFFLYDEWVKESGIQFIPAPKCEDIYYVDNFDRNRFIRVDYIFSKAHEEKLAELEYIAYSLGAKSCSIEIIEDNSSDDMEDFSQETKTKGHGIAISENVKDKSRHKTSNHRSGRSTTYFEGNNEPVVPQLKWFANDDNIKGLIEMRCSTNDLIKSKTLILEGTSSQTMSRSVACSIDATYKH